MKVLKKIISVILCFVMIFGSVHLAGFVGLNFSSFGELFALKAKAETQSGTVGDNITWTIDIETGVLTISGEGDMPSNYWDNEEVLSPWYNNELIKTVIIENGITSIGRAAFYYCKYIESVTLPDSLVTIERSAFSECRSLSSIVIPDSVTSIASYAFYSCVKLSDITLGDGLTTVPTHAFLDCPLKNVVMGDGFKTVPSEIIKKDKLKSIVLGNGIKSVSCFYDCTSLTNVTFSESITTIGENAFKNCKIKNLVLPDNITSVDNWAFDGCPIETVVMGSGLTSIPYSLRGMHLVYSSSSAYEEGINKTLKTFVIGERVKAIDENCFKNCDGLKNIVIPDRVQSIGSSAFSGCDNLETVVIGNGVKTIGSYAFSSCDKLKEVKLGESITEIGSYAFYNCYLIEEIIIPKLTTLIGSYAFHSCANLMQIEIPLSLSTVQNNAFFNCVNLTRVVYEGSEEDWLNISISSTENEYLLGARRYSSHYHDDHTETYLRGFIQVSCESSGYSGDLCCTHCDWLYRVGEHQTPFGHNYQETSVDATCTGNGFKYTICQNCGKSSLDGVYPATGHSYNSKVTRPTCTDGGYTLNVCSKCGLSTITDETEPLGHDYVSTVIDTTCTKDGYTVHRCTRCVASYIDGESSAYGHTYVDTEVSSTCTGVGYTSHKCSTCGDEYITNEIPAKGHKYEPITVSATCTTSGYTFYICSDCGMAYRGDEIPATGHNYKETVVAPTCTEGGYTVHECLACGDTYIDTETESIGHNYTETVVAATCDNDGYTRHECQNCHDVYDTDITSAKGHKLNSAVVEATCTSGGFTIYSCSVCGYSSISNETEAIGHNYVPSIVIQQTCIQDGCTINICSNCSGVSKTDGNPATGHTFNEWKVTEEATEESEGLEQRNCKNCGYTEDKLISIINRTTFNVTFVADGKTVAVVEYVKGATSVEEPPVPHKDRFEGRWSNYTLDDTDITVEAIYDVIDVDSLNGIEHGKSATYNATSGVATINLYAASDAETIISTTSKKIPLDIVLVVDQSGSMDEKLGGSTTKKQALINSATSVVNLVYDDASTNGVDHRIAIVGFGMGNKANGSDYPAYLNTEILTTGGNPIQMNKATSADYADAMMNVNVSGTLNSDITKAINNIDAKGATAADFGLSMANNIFANNIDNEGRERIVIFMTDGTPTYSNGYSKDVANAAILHANELKNTYGASVYSIGVMSQNDSSDSNVNRFMNFVSSNYIDATNVTGSYAQQSSAYYLNVTNTNALSGIFEEIIIENITRTAIFDNITIIDTVSKYFTLTSQQEKALRVNVIENYGVRNQDITITRNDDGTTLIVIENIHPIDNGEKFVVDFSFEVSADEDISTAGVYPTNNTDAGIIIDDAENYECVFTSPYITVPHDRATAVFKINDEIYAIKTVVDGESVSMPETDFEGEYEFSGWDLSLDPIYDGYAEFNATFETQKYVVIWNIDGETIKESYTPGDVINVPEVESDRLGYAFRRWNGNVPVTMPAVSIEFTAVFGDHEHKYSAEIIKAVTCLEDGEVKYTCSICDKSYTETVSAYGEHCWKVIVSVAGDEATYETLECENCGQSEERMLEYSFVEGEANERGYTEYVTHDFNLVDDEGNKYQPESDINISMPVDEHYGNVFDMNVYRVDDEGNKIECNSDYDNGVVSFDADHFSTYIFVPVHFCSINYNHIDTDENNYCDTCDEIIVELCTVNWVVDGETVLAYSCVPNSETIVPDDPEKEGCTFAGWSPEIPETVTESNLTFVAIWEAEEHECIGVLVGACDATCTRNGHTGNTYCSTCGTLMQAGETISKTGHSYGEWSEWKSSKTNYSSRYRDCETCGHRDVETKYVGGSGRYVSIDEFMNWIFSKIFNLIFGWMGIDFSTKFN